MLQVDTVDVLKDLEEYLTDTVRRLEQMVRGFSYEIALTAINKTPLGDSETYQALYQRRKQVYGLPAIEGIARGGWQYSLDGSLDFQKEFSGPNSGAGALGAVKSHAMNYQLGETVLIGNSGPYIGLLEQNWSPQTNGEGIMQPTLDSIMAVHRADLMRYYKEG